MENEEIEPLNCQECGKDVDELFSKSAFKGNKETRSFCKECYSIVHEEEF